MTRSQLYAAPALALGSVVCFAVAGWSLEPRTAWIAAATGAVLLLLALAAADSTGRRR